MPPYQNSNIHLPRPAALLPPRRRACKMKLASQAKKNGGRRVCVQNVGVSCVNIERSKLSSRWSNLQPATTSHIEQETRDNEARKSAPLPRPRGQTPADFEAAANGVLSGEAIFMFDHIRTRPRPKHVHDSWIGVLRVLVQEISIFRLQTTERGPRRLRFFAQNFQT